MGLIYGTKRTAFPTIAKALILTFLLVTSYNLVSFSQSTAQAVDRSFSAAAEANVYGLTDRLTDPDDFAEFRESPANIESLSNFYSELNSADAIEFISVFDQPIPVVDPRGGGSLEYGYGTGQSTRGKYVDETSGEEVMDVKSVQLNQKAFDFYNLEVGAGSGFDWERIDYSVENTPVLLGSDYIGLYEVGETMRGSFYSRDMTFQVAGFLEPDSSIFYQSDINFFLDSYVVVPYPSSIVDFPKEETFFYGILAFAMINSNIAADTRLSTDDVLNVVLGASTSSGFDHYALLNVPTYLVQFSLVKNLINENLSLLIYIQIALALSTLVGVAALNRFIHSRREGLIRIYWTLGEPRSRLARTALASTAIEYAITAIFSIAVISALPNQSSASALPLVVLLIACFAVDSVWQQKMLIRTMSVMSRESA